eukprot:1834616-Rhodomonas_salina.2
MAARAMPVTCWWAVEACACSVWNETQSWPRGASMRWKSLREARGFKSSIAPVHRTTSAAPESTLTPSRTSSVHKAS